jgi:peptidoglycan/xylan/chitin deacetylase (PgdA/CDA1 family)
MVLPVVAFLITAAWWEVTEPEPAAMAVSAVTFAPASASQAAPTAEQTATPVPTIAAATATPSRTPSPTPTDTPTPTRTRTPAPTRTPSPTPTATPTPTPILPTPDGVARRVQIPILMYHYVSDPPPGAGELRQDLSVSPQRFRAQLQYLREQGYESITLADLALALTRGTPLPLKPVILTFDDGYADAYTNAFPLLKEFGYSGTFFLMTKPIDENNVAYVSWTQVKEMHAAGMKFEPHSYNHPDMTGRGYEFLVFQILAPKEAIEARTGETCRFFGYPSGRYDQFVIDVLRSANFWGAVTTEQGATHTAGGLFALHRVRIRGSDDLATFARKLTLDW